MPFVKAQRKKAKLRLAITGTAGAGKTYGALLIAQGLGGKIALIDTENGSGNLYSDLCDYDICNIAAPYDPRKYIETIHEAEKTGYDIIIIDTISHEWSGAGGCLDVHSQIVATSKGGNSFTAWAKITPLHDAFLNALTASPCHIIATIRSKTEFIINENRQVVKVGLAPVQRDNVEYEFGTVFDLNSEHLAVSTKDRSGLFADKVFSLSPKVGEALKNWLDIVPNTQKGGEA